MTNIDYIIWSNHHPFLIPQPLTILIFLRQKFHTKLPTNQTKPSPRKLPPRKLASTEVPPTLFRYHFLPIRIPCVTWSRWFSKRPKNNNSWGRSFFSWNPGELLSFTLSKVRKVQLMNITWKWSLLPAGILCGVSSTGIFSAGGWPNFWSSKYHLSIQSMDPPWRQGQTRLVTVVVSKRHHLSATKKAADSNGCHRQEEVQDMNLGPPPWKWQPLFLDPPFETNLIQVYTTGCFRK